MQIIRWLKQHGDAALEVHATLMLYPNDQNPPETRTQAHPCSWVPYLHGVSVLLALLPNLRHLRLSCEKGFLVVEQEPFSLQILTRLQTLRLSMASDGSWNSITMSPLQHLTALKHLDNEV